MKRKLLITGILTVLLFTLSACSGTVNYNTVEGSLYDENEFSASAILQMSQVLEDNILENWYVSGITPDNFDRSMIDQMEDAVRSVYNSGYRSWYTAIEDIGYTSPETLPSDISVGDVRYYINGDGILTVEANLKGTGENAHDAILEYQVDRHKVPLSLGVNVQRSLGEKMTNAGLNTLLGMGMAFFVLIIISLVISLFAILSGNGKKKPKEAAKGTAAPATAKAIDNAVAQIAQREEAQTDKEIAAVIMAAIAAYEADTGQSGGVVTGIRRSTGESLLPQMPDVVPQDGVFIRPVRKHDKRNWKKAI